MQISLLKLNSQEKLQEKCKYIQIRYIKMFSLTLAISLPYTIMLFFQLFLLRNQRVKFKRMSSIFIDISSKYKLFIQYLPRLIFEFAHLKFIHYSMFNQICSYKNSFQFLFQLFYYSIQLFFFSYLKYNHLFNLLIIGQFFSSDIIKYFIQQNNMKYQQPDKTNSPISYLDWNKRKFISNGAYSYVYEVPHISDEKKYAIKQIDLYEASGIEDYTQIAKQIEILNRVKSDYVIQLYDYKIFDGYCFLVLQLCETNLKTMISRNRSKIPENQCIKILFNIICGLKVLIENSYIHCDIKPANVVLKNGVWKICDFGLSKKIIDYQNTCFNAFHGTPAYMSPQILKKQKFSIKSDVWSLGILFYELLYGFPPWPFQNIQQYTKMACQSKLAFPIGKKISDVTKDFVIRCLKVSEKDRMSWQEVLDHPLISQNFPSTQQQIEQTLVNPVLLSIINQIQQQVTKNRIDVNLVFEKYSHLYSLKFKKFWELLNEINESITTYETDFLFKVLDRNFDNQITLNQLQVLFSDIEHKECNDILKRQLQNIIGLMQCRNININTLFNEIDKDRTGSIDRKQFNYFMSKIAPKLNEQQKNLLFRQFDLDNNGLISQQQFVKQVSYGVMKRRKQTSRNKGVIRAKRNLNNLKIFLKYSGLSAAELMMILDQNFNGKLEILEVKKMMESIGYVISQQQTEQVFNSIDEDKSGFIDLEELVSFLQ